MAGNFKCVVDHPRVPEQLCIYGIQLTVENLILIIGLLYGLRGLECGNIRSEGKNLFGSTPFIAG